MPRTQSPPRTQVVKMRASCDSCLRSKVKCSKNKPVCSRCLSSGSDCNYSPSSRAGKPRKQPIALQSVENDNYHRGHHSRNYSMDSTLSHQSLTSSDDGISAYPSPYSQNGFQSHATPVSLTFSSAQDQLTTPSYSLPFGMSSNKVSGRSHSSSLDSWASADAIPLAAYSPLPNARDLNVNASAFSSYSSSEQGSDSYYGLIPENTNQSYDLMSTYLNSQILDSSNKTSQKNCDCANACLQSLCEIHQLSAQSPQLRSVSQTLDLNTTAIEACRTFLNCQSCLARLDLVSSAMVVSNLTGAILSLYRTALQSPLAPQSRMHIQTIHLPQIENNVTRLRELSLSPAFWNQKQSPSTPYGGLAVQEALATYLTQDLRSTYAYLETEDISFTGAGLGLYGVPLCTQSPLF
jgi:Fungal Zn(2)-Cys(6) binuclear cluster domain